MSAEWVSYKLEEIGRIVTGRTPPSKVIDAFSSSGVPFVTPRDMDGRRRIDTTERYVSRSGLLSVIKSLVPPDSIAVSCIGSDMGKAALITKESVTNQQINTIIVNSESFNPKFIYYVLTTKQEAFKSIAGGSATPILNKGHFGKFEIQVPGKEEQDSIVKCLDSLDQRIELNSKMNETLEQIAQALFKSWFVDFDPVKAKMEALAAGGSQVEAELAAMRVISAKTAEELKSLEENSPEAFSKLQETAALFPSAMQESELGLIPEEWRVSTIGEEVHISGGGTPSTKNKDFWENGSIHWTTPKDLSNLQDKVLVDTERKITELGLEKISSGLLPVDTVLLSSRAPVGYLALVKVPVAINQGYIAMRCENILSPEYVLQWAASNMEEIKQRASGTTFAEISKKNFRPILVIVPTEGIIKKYSDQAQHIYKHIYALVEENKNLSIIRDTLLPPLLSGRQSIKERMT